MMPRLEDFANFTKKKKREIKLILGYKNLRGAFKSKMQ